MFMGRQLLLFLSLHFQGDWDSIFNAVQNKVYFDQELIAKTIDGFEGHYVTIIDDEYPLKLKNVYKPPFVLFYEGNFSLLDKPSLSVVGTRLCSDYSVQAIEKIIKELKGQFVIISGLAKGIDTVAHRTIIEESGSTIAILGAGIDICYPKSNYDLYTEIKEKHLLLSEYPPHTPIKKSSFPFRNRLISALGDALLVGEMSFQSGTYHTVRFSLELGKDIFCIPHDIFDNDQSNELIKDGAVVVTSGYDILKEMKIK